MDHLIKAFKELRECWFDNSLRLYASERQWEEDKDQTKSREKYNRRMKRKFDKQTQLIIDGGGSDIPPPTCEADLDLWT